MEKVGTGESGLLIFKLTDKNRFIGYTDKRANEEKILRSHQKVYTLTGDSFIKTLASID